MSTEGGGCCGPFVPDAGGGTGSGGGGGGEVDVSRDGALVVNNATDLNFIGTRVVDAGGGQADITPAVIFDDAVAGTDVNIRSTRGANQSPIDNTQNQITNFGSQDHINEPGATGATGPGSTIGGGDDNTASGEFSTVPGGVGNFATDYASYAEGNFNTSSGVGSHAEGGGTLASGDSAHAEGLITQATGEASHAEGNSTVASGQFSHAEGDNTNATDSFAHAEGKDTTASNDAAHAEGITTVASGLYSHAEGETTTANNRGAHAEGRNTLASGQWSHAEGDGSIASNQSAHAEGTSEASGHTSHAEGSGCLASGVEAHAEGGICEAIGQASHAQGRQAQALRDTQDAHASGATNPGEIQTSMLVFRGTTPGLGAAESVALVYGPLGTSGLALEDDKAYMVRVSAVVGGVQAGPTRVARAFSVDFCVRRAAGVSTITGLLPGAAAGDAATIDWTFVVSIGAAPDRIVFTFTTGAVASACGVAARVEFTEVLF